MPAETKAVNLTEDEITELIRFHGMSLYNPSDTRIERINYLNKRLKAFKEEVTNTKLPEIKTDASTIAQGWGQTNG